MIRRLPLIAQQSPRSHTWLAAFLRGPGQQQRPPGTGGLWFPRLELLRGTPAARAGAQRSWLPSASRPELDTAQTARRHRLQGSSLALPKSVGKHRRIAFDAVPRALETHAEIIPFFTDVMLCVLISFHLEQDRATPFQAQSSSSPAPDIATLPGSRAGRDQPLQPSPHLCAASLTIYFPLGLLPQTLSQ